MSFFPVFYTLNSRFVWPLFNYPKQKRKLYKLNRLKDKESGRTRVYFAR